MTFRPMDLATWKRAETYRHYTTAVPCSFSVTVTIAVGPLMAAIKARGLRTYPVHLYMIAKVVNTMPAFRMAVNSAGEPGCWDRTDPAYTIFNPAAETFSCIHTAFDDRFDRFYQACVADIEAWRTADGLFPKQPMPKNVFTISSRPWLPFIGFTLTVSNSTPCLPPIFTIGRCLDDGHMPLAIQVHHAVCDGYHVGRFVEALQALAARCEDWL